MKNILYGIIGFCIFAFTFNYLFIIPSKRNELECSQLNTKITSEYQNQEKNDFITSTNHFSKMHGKCYVEVVDTFSNPNVTSTGTIEYSSTITTTLVDAIEDSSVAWCSTLSQYESFPKISCFGKNSEVISNEDFSSLEKSYMTN